MIRTTLTAVSLLTFLVGCSGGKMEESKLTFPAIKDVPEIAWKKLSGKRIFFGHQSVGSNIIEGIKGSRSLLESI